MSVGDGDKTVKSTSSGMVVLLLGGLLLLFGVAGMLLMESSKVDGEYPYNPASAIVVSEFLKFLISAAGFYREFGPTSQPTYTVGAANFIKFSVPGLLYAITNIGHFSVLYYINATEYQVLANMKIICTAVVFRLFLRRPQKVIQWCCMVFLTVGMVVATPRIESDTSNTGNDARTGFIIMVVMSLCSAFAGVYSEFLLKFSDDNVHFQNMQLYFWGMVICTAQFLHSAPPDHNFFAGYNTLTWIVILVQSLYGQVVGFTLKYADNMVKVYANALASITSATLSHVLFDQPLSLGMVNGSILVGMSVVMYYGNHEKLLQEDTACLKDYHKKQDSEVDI